MIAKLWASVFFSTIFPVSAFADTQEIVAECRTQGTSLPGAVGGCDSQVSRLTAPEGYALLRESLKGGLVEKNGSENDCRIGWADYVDVIPGVTQPRTITLQAHARSPKGHGFGRGWTKCKYTVEMVKLPG
ncbi:hypothetical protein KPG66_16840 [Mycetohabitans sp. B2]|uniref:hypothetical protein n=1 Tax=Mycetohabitans sp. B2 TaxID=2841274 RepID=UPI001F36419B|nr:hypothetical protein [Mycetohabitans sp. B2]MCF7697636.1 hypothetical protein [Mycetohabitans sp. B2]